MIVQDFRRPSITVTFRQPSIAVTFLGPFYTMSIDEIYESTTEERVAALYRLRHDFPGRLTRDEEMSILAYTESVYKTLNPDTVAGVAAGYIIDYKGIRSFIKFLNSLMDPDASE